MKNNATVSRRSFLEKLFTASVVGMALPTTVLGAITPIFKRQGNSFAGTYIVSLTDYPDLQQVSGSVRFIIPEISSNFYVIITRTGENEFNAVNARCPHNGFHVKKANAEGILICEAHFSEFQPDGTYIWGPANGQDLIRYGATYDGNNTLSIEIPDLPSSVGEINGEATFVRLHSTGPLATNAVIEFGIEQPAHITLALFALDGNEVMRLTDDRREAGTYRVPLDFGHLPNGLYLFRLQTSTGFVETGKLIVER